MNPMLSSLVSRQKKARQPGAAITDQQRRIELLARLQNPKASHKQLKEQEKKK